MQVLSVNVGIPREIEWHGDRVLTGIYKYPAAGRVEVRSLNLAGDRQADLTVHGGTDKAVYVYPSEHYRFWNAHLAQGMTPNHSDMGRDGPDLPLPAGVFGENLTISGLLEEDVHIGDQLRIGSSTFAVTQPRIPCFKLAARFNNPEIVRTFLQSGRSGWYLRVTGEGTVGAGDAVSMISRDPDAISIADFNSIFRTRRAEPDTLERLVRNGALPDSWAAWLTNHINRGGHET